MFLHFVQKNLMRFWQFTLFLCVEQTDPLAVNLRLRYRCHWIVHTDALIIYGSSIKLLDVCEGCMLSLSFLIVWKQ